MYVSVLVRLFRCMYEVCLADFWSFYNSDLTLHGVKLLAQKPSFSRGVLLEVEIPFFSISHTPNLCHKFILSEFFASEPSAENDCFDLELIDYNRACAFSE